MNPYQVYIFNEFLIYIDYNCYSCLDSKFYFCEVTDTGLEYLNNALKLMPTKIDDFTANNNILQWIIKHLTCNSVFMHIDTSIACEYINFWLNKKDKDLNFYKYSNFNNFKKFMENFYTVSKGAFGFYKICTNSIKLLEKDEYNKMNILYKLYKLYDDLKLVHPNTDYWKKTCENVQFITKQANDAAHLYKDDDGFIKVLRDLRDTIKNGQGRYKELCASNLKQLDTMVTLKAFPDRLPDPPTHIEISQPSISLEKNNPEALEKTKSQALAQHVSKNVIGNPLEPKEDLQESSPTEQLTSEEHLKNVSHGMSPHEESPLLELPFSAQQHIVSQHGNSRHAGDLREDVFKLATFPRERNEESRDAHSRSAYTGYNSVEEEIRTEGVITPTDGTQSYLENIKGAITGVLGEVDPVPVVGVSGGMGALFLLFR
ncbi:hypothetical protein PVNG_06459, partial [Plasmodium vivax North Korean]